MPRSSHEALYGTAPLRPTATGAARHRAAGSRLAGAMALTGALVLSPALKAQAQEPQIGGNPVYGVVQMPNAILSLDASASAEVPVDRIQLTLFVEDQAADPAALNLALNQRTDAALRLARASDEVRRDLVQAKTGGFSISPTTDRDGKITGWRGRSELELSSGDFAAASRLGGTLQSQMQVGGVAFSLTPAAQQHAEAGLITRAIDQFKQQATTAAQGFGYTGFTVREVSIGRSGLIRPQRNFRALAAAPAMAKMDPVAVEGGTSTVTVTVSGSVQMVH